MSELTKEEKINRIETQFDLFIALKRLSLLGTDIGISVNAEDAGISIQLVANGNSIKHTFVYDELTNNNVNILGYKFTGMLTELYILHGGNKHVRNNTKTTRTIRC